MTSQPSSRSRDSRTATPAPPGGVAVPGPRAPEASGLPEASGAPGGPEPAEVPEAANAPEAGQGPADGSPPADVLPVYRGYLHGVLRSKGQAVREQLDLLARHRRAAGAAALAAERLRADEREHVARAESLRAARERAEEELRALRGEAEDAGPTEEEQRLGRRLLEALDAAAQSSMYAALLAGEAEGVAAGRLDGGAAAVAARLEDLRRDARTAAGAAAEAGLDPSLLSALSPQSVPALPSDPSDPSDGLFCAPHRLEVPTPDGSAYRLDLPGPRAVDTGLLGEALEGWGRLLEQVESGTAERLHAAGELAAALEAAGAAEQEALSAGQDTERLDALAAAAAEEAAGRTGRAVRVCAEYAEQVREWADRMRTAVKSCSPEAAPAAGAEAVPAGGVPEPAPAGGAGAGGAVGGTPGTDGGSGPGEGPGPAPEPGPDAAPSTVRETAAKEAAQVAAQEAPHEAAQAAAREAFAALDDVVALVAAAGDPVPGAGSTPAASPPGPGADGGVLDPGVPDRVARAAHRTVALLAGGNARLREAAAGRRAVAEAHRAGVAARRGELASRDGAEPAPPSFRDAEREPGTGAPFYRLVEFTRTDEDGFGPAERAGLEAALEAAGLLDAWVTADGLLLDPDTRDVLVRVDGRRARADRDGDEEGADGPRTLAEVLRPVECPGSGVGAERVAAVLEATAFGPAGDLPVWITDDGRWRLGTLGGAHDKERAEYIGADVRAETLRLRLAAVDAELQDADEAVRRAECELAECDGVARELDEMLPALPSGRPVAAAHAAAEAAEALVRASADRAAQAARVAEEARARAAGLRDAAEAAARAAALPTDAVALHGVRAALERLRYELPALRRSAAALRAGLDRHDREREAFAAARRRREEAADRHGARLAELARERERAGVDGAASEDAPRGPDGPSRDGAEGPDSPGDDGAPDGAARGPEDRGPEAVARQREAEVWLRIAETAVQLAAAEAEWARAKDVRTAAEVERDGAVAALSERQAAAVAAGEALCRVLGLPQVRRCSGIGDALDAAVAAATGAQAAGGTGKPGSATGARARMKALRALVERLVDHLGPPEDDVADSELLSRVGEHDQVLVEERDGVVLWGRADDARA
ncbi:hypothetical protein [Streptomyces sp. HB2AG]|uniref:hypothetical protein n=1 Tax=Streptomyces sp. HB2AG TaxID=2983400 RepID=UPI0022AA0067|nr:hypothetical protein [Streptomyces sp. HB2AG]MCZ2525574.1 hypothetical protein [Streptomyces sp. HB2AG]